jgi:4-hydroxy-tetrahydrodipicolinate reductase
MALPLKIASAGASGRMGRMLIKAASQQADLKLIAALDGPHSEFLGEDSGLLAGIAANHIVLQSHFPTEPFDALIDFTTPVATKVYLEHSSKLGLIHVIGTTGFSAADLALIQQKSETCCIIRSGNMSLGVNLLAALVKKAAQSLDPSFDIEIVEMHHRMKIDAPSGTALLLGEAAAEGRHISLSDHSVRVRDGETGVREEGTIGFASLRGGTVIGDHSVTFAGNGERLVLSHIAEDRSLFAQGALKATIWARGKANGLYSMMDVLDLS